MMRTHAIVILLLLAGAARAGSQPAAFESGMQALMQGNYAEAYCQWRPLADQGYAEAQYHVGWLYANGNGLAVDLSRALEFWTAAAEQGHADAQFAVGLAYTTGDGVDRDLNRAVDWYLKAARLGHQDARDILLRLNGDRTVNLFEDHPELAYESWFGWGAEVRGERINVRGGPGTSHKIVASLDKGSEVRVVGRRGDWYMVVLPGDGGDGDRVAWIFGSLLSRTSG
ncbi:MAG: SEL1-like repeat protein [Gammaproteobacteria bacterium]|nr:SEL1-like repeat protein [Gammaproteobacteria bacterium]